MTSAVYIGDVKHRRFAVNAHQFNYPIYMLWVDLMAPDSLDGVHPWLGTKGFKALKFCQQDYLEYTDQPQHTISQRAFTRIAQLGVSDSFTGVYMLGQLRCLGVYFSPVNFYFYQIATGDFTHMVAEVSNTPWNERHYYLVPLEKKVNFKKTFSVSPFMDLDMNYHWHIRFNKDNTMIHIENKKDDQLLFDATLRLERQTLTKATISRLLKRFPAMTWTIFKGIYVHAFKLFCKRVPFIGHSGNGS